MKTEDGDTKVLLERAALTASFEALRVGASLTQPRARTELLLAAASIAQFRLSDLQLRPVGEAHGRNVAVPIFHALLLVRLHQSLEYLIRTESAEVITLRVLGQPRVRVRIEGLTLFSSGDACTEWG